MHNTLPHTPPPPPPRTPINDHVYTYRYIHEMGVCHRSLFLDNIMLTTDSISGHHKAVLCDFGDSTVANSMCTRSTCLCIFCVIVVVLVNVILLSNFFIK